ncbi:MAG: amidohydrolase, partial [Actinomycetales bacterium]
MSSLLIRNARLVPLHPGESAPPHPVDVAVTDGLVTAVAPGADRPDGAEVVDAGGRWLVPGLWDQHVHFTQWVVRRQRVDLAPAASAAEAVAIMRAALP